MGNDLLRPNDGGTEELSASVHFSSNFDTIINATGVGMWDWDLHTGKIVHSGQLERIAGYEKGELPPTDGSARDLLIFPQDRKRADAIIASCVEGQIESYETEFRIQCKNGEIKWVQDRGAVAERDDSGEALRIVGMFYDVNRFKKTEESLLDKMHLLDFAAGLSGLGTLEWVLPTDSIRFDDDFLAMLGYSAEDDIARNFRTLEPFIHSEDYRTLSPEIHQYLAADAQCEAYSKQLRARCKNGSFIWVLATARIAEWDANGNPQRLIASMLNVDKLVRAELEAQKALLENQRRKAQLEEEIVNANKGLEQMRATSVAMFDANPYMSIIFDDRLQPIDCNPAMMKYFGYTTKDDLLRNILTILIPAIPDDTPPKRFIDRMEGVLQSGFDEFETYFSFNSTAVPMHVTLKRIEYMGKYAIAAYQLDLSAMKKNENELRHQDSLLQAANAAATMLMEMEQRDFLQTLHAVLRLLCKSLRAHRAYIWKNGYDHGLYAKDLCTWVEEGIVHHAYGERKLYYHALLPDWESRLASFINAPARDIPESLKAFPGFSDVQSLLLIPIFLQGAFWGVLGFDECRDSARSFTQSEVQIMRSAGMLIGAAVLRSEMTENLIEAKEEALAGSRAKSDFLSRMSHEIRTPLNAIIGMTAVAHKSDDIGKMQYCLNKIDVASRQLLDLINDILDMSKIEADRLELSPVSFSFDSMMQDILQMTNVKMEEKGLTLMLEYAQPFTRYVIADELRVSQVLINLLNNAAKFTPENGNIYMRISHSTLGGESALLHAEIQDTGIGITTEQQERLFCAFEQADGSITRQFGGTGLGLAICKRIVELMDGHIWVDSTPGQGSCFQFDIKIQLGDVLEEDTCKAYTASSTLPGEWKDKYILLVEDIEINREILINLLSETGIRIDCAEDGEEAVRCFRSNAEQYDLILMDVQMPKMDGLLATKYIRGSGHQKAGSIPIIAMTANAFKEDVELCLDAGMNDHIAKPIDFMALQATLAKYLQNT